MHFFFTSLHILLFLLPNISLSLHIASLTILCFMPFESSNSSPFSKFRFHSISQCLGSLLFFNSLQTVACKLGPDVKDYGLWGCTPTHAPTHAHTLYDFPLDVCVGSVKPRETFNFFIKKSTHNSNYFAIKWGQNLTFFPLIFLRQNPN